MTEEWLPGACVAWGNSLVSLAALSNSGGGGTKSSGLECLFSCRIGGGGGSSSNGSQNSIGNKPSCSVRRLRPCVVVSERELGPVPMHMKTANCPIVMCLHKFSLVVLEQRGEVRKRRWISDTPTSETISHDRPLTVHQVSRSLSPARLGSTSMISPGSSASSSAISGSNECAHRSAISNSFV